MAKNKSDDKKYHFVDCDLRMYAVIFWVEGWGYNKTIFGYASNTYGKECFSLDCCAYAKGSKIAENILWWNIDIKGFRDVW